MEPVGFSPSALSQELAALPYGCPMQLQRAMAGGDHGGEGWLWAGTWLQILLSPGLSWPSFGLTVMLPSPAVSGLWTSWACEELESGDGRSAGF